MSTKQSAVQYCHTSFHIKLLLYLESMTLFSESDRLFRFDKRWKVIKYDEHRYYQTLSGRSFSGIDFAGIWNDDSLYLIEIKNFFQHDNQGIIEDINQFALEIKEKLMDTLELIRIINKYHQRSWSYRCFNQIVMRFPSLHYTWWFWTRMKQMIDQETFEFLLFVDSVEDRTMLLNAIQDAIHEETTALPSITLLPLDSDQVQGLEISLQDG